MPMYKADQTNGKTCGGGRPGGNLKLLYQVPLTASFVGAPLSIPNVNGMPTATTGFLGTWRRISGK